MTGLLLSLCAASAGTFVYAPHANTYEHFAGPLSSDLFAYSWYNHFGVPPAPWYAAVRLGEFRGTIQEMNNIVGVWQYPVDTEGGGLNGHRVFLGNVEPSVGIWIAKRDVWLAIDPDVVYIQFDPQNALVCIPATWPMDDESDCNRSSIPALNIAFWPNGF